MANQANQRPHRRSQPARTREGQGRLRRRGATLDDALLQAAWEEVSAVGYTNLTMEGVAARARTGKTVLYRRWPNRAALVLAAMRRRMGSLASQIPDTGDLRQDVLIVLRQFRDRYQQIGPDITHGLLTELHDIPPDVFEITPGVMMTILTHAAQRGEVRLHNVTPRIAALPGDLLRHQLLLSDGSASEAFLAEVVDDIFLPLVMDTGRPARRGKRVQRSMP
jgi:AcrR family transcriptional regulator